MVSLIGNSNAFTSFTFNNTQIQANTGQEYSSSTGFQDTTPQSGISSSDLARIAFKDEENTFTKKQVFAHSFFYLNDDLENSYSQLLTDVQSLNQLITQNETGIQQIETDVNQIKTDVEQVQSAASQSAYSISQLQIQIAPIQQVASLFQSRVTGFSLFSGLSYSADVQHLLTPLKGIHLPDTQDITFFDGEATRNVRQMLISNEAATTSNGDALEALTNELSNKASTSSVNDVTTVINSLENTLNNKADASQLSDKLNVTAFNAFQTNLNSTIDERIGSFTTTLDNRTLNTLIDSKLITANLKNNITAKANFLESFTEPQGARYIFPHFNVPMFRHTSWGNNYEKPRKASTEPTRYNKWNLMIAMVLEYPNYKIVGVFVKDDGEIERAEFGQAPNSISDTLPHAGYYTIPDYSRAELNSKSVYPLQSNTGVFVDNAPPMTADLASYIWDNMQVHNHTNGSLAYYENGYWIHGYKLQFYPSNVSITNSIFQELETAVTDTNAIASTVQSLEATTEGLTNNLNNNYLTSVEADNKYLQTDNHYTKLESDEKFFKADDVNAGKLFKADTVKVLRNSQYEDCITSSDLVTALQNNVNQSSGSVNQNVVTLTGQHFKIPQSPYPIVFVDTDGRLGSAIFSDNFFLDHVYGSLQRTPANKYKQGLVPSSECGCDDEVLCGNGNWRKLQDMIPTLDNIQLLPDNLPQFSEITSSNKFVKTSMCCGGKFVYSTASTDDLVEGTNNLFYTAERNEAKITEKLNDGSITNAVIDHLESQTLTAVSDKKLKRHIKPITNKTNKLSKLKPVEFNYRKEPFKKRYGLIAQQVKKVLPELVHKNEKTKSLSVNYLDIIALLIQDNQDMRNLINNMQIAITRLSNKVV